MIFFVKKPINEQYNYQNTQTVEYKIQIQHSLIWLSLTEYTKDNIDSVIASFYLGLFHLEEGFF